ncbi:MAG: mechanosensitive ion channel family protein [Methanobacteriaceae archaeon]|jgi:small-conductance mechanosensitive channel|nr:mechanosensitive ion channel family protein [Methanobacteriaceae archaeon]
MEFVSFNNIFYQIIFTIITLIVIYIALKIIKRITNKMKEKPKVNDTLINLINDLLRYISYLIALILILDIFHIDLTSIFVSIGIVGISVGFATKDIISNFLSGIFIISDDHLNLGDTIEINSIKGKIKQINFRTTTLIDDSGVITVIPNSVLSTQPYNRYKHLEEYRIDLLATIPLHIDIEDFEKQILNTIKNIKEINKNKIPKIFTQKISAEGVIVKISIWVNDDCDLSSTKLMIVNKIRLLISENKKRFEDDK